MYNLSLTACSFYFRKYNAKKQGIYYVNKPLICDDQEGNTYNFDNICDLFVDFFTEYQDMKKDEKRQQSFCCEYLPDRDVETDKFKMICVKIKSGIYGNTSDIIDGQTEKVKLRKGVTDIDIRPFYLMVIFPKDNKHVKVQKGMLFFQNVGQFGVKTITTSFMQNHFSKKYKISLHCKTIAPETFIKKVFVKDNIKKLIMIRNVKSKDSADNLFSGYGREERVVSNLAFKESTWNEILSSINYMTGRKHSMFEFEGIEYDALKVEVDIGGRPRKIDVHNIENLSVIEGIPDEIRMRNGHPNLEMLVEHFKQTANEYLQEMVLQID